LVHCHQHRERATIQFAGGKSSNVAVRIQAFQIGSGGCCHFADFLWPNENVLVSRIVTKAECLLHLG